MLLGTAFLIQNPPRWDRLHKTLSPLDIHHNFYFSIDWACGLVVWFSLSIYLVQNRAFCPSRSPGRGPGFNSPRVQFLPPVRSVGPRKHIFLHWAIYLAMYTSRVKLLRHWLYLRCWAQKLFSKAAGPGRIYTLCRGKKEKWMIICCKVKKKACFSKFL